MSGGGVRSGNGVRAPWLDRVTGRAWAALVVVYVIWGSTYLGIELAGETMPPLFAAGVRFLLAGGLMAGWVIWRSGTAPLRPPRNELVTAVVVGILLPGANGLLFVAEREVPTGISSLIIGSVPLFIVLMRLAVGERPGRVAIAGTLVGFAGLALLARPGGEGTTKGLLLLLGSAFCWSLGSVIAARRPLPPNALAATALEMLAGGAVLLPIGIVLLGSDSLDPGDYSTRSLAGFVYLVLIGSLVGYTAYVWLLGNAPLGTVATYAYVNPVVAIALGVVVLNETISWRMVLGAVIILASVAVVISDGNRRVTAPIAR
jgi:drug/metabolite transporter (DMT)-like permease